jgi:hypothetical protein
VVVELISFIGPNELKIGKRNSLVKLMEDQHEIKTRLVRYERGADFLNSIRDALVSLPGISKVNVIKFFGYQCIYCSRLVAVMQQERKANPELRYILRKGLSSCHAGKTQRKDPRAASMSGNRRVPRLHVLSDSTGHISY